MKRIGLIVLFLVVVLFLSGCVKESAESSGNIPPV